MGVLLAVGLALAAGVVSVAGPGGGAGQGVEGRVVDGGGRALRDVLVTAMSAPADDSSSATLAGQATSDGSGRFYIDGLAPGKYFVFADDGVHSFAYYPGVSARRDAEAVTVGAKEFVGLESLVLGAGARIGGSVASGPAVDVSGVRVAAFRVWIEGGGALKRCGFGAAVLLCGLPGFRRLTSDHSGFARIG
ncbi:MAG: carboxypeptidase-like regulatory domain-containing protein, partial [Bifidobacteriaceae bacterium]|nr:carboxypeptidase-like regulatory domain-containing protein [Bifidobacteriaceae bacterium]